jgi:type IV pilus assembly protein PilY1
VLTYGNDSDDDYPIAKLFVGTNDGGLRMINEYDGKEGWIFYPNSMLGNTSANAFVDSGRQSLLKANDLGSHIYGIDDTPVARVFDQNRDGRIDPGSDFVHVYFGLRRGGDQLFAINATPTSEITDREQAATPVIEPEILWRIDGTDTDFAALGQTWSTPRPARILGKDGPGTVLIFGGGYSVEQDGAAGDGVAADGGDIYNDESNGDADGDAIYIVDADTGERIWWAGGTGSGAHLEVSGMNTAIAAPVTLLDSNGDSFTDRIYAVDLRGQVFRVDLQIDASSDADSELGNSTGGVLARLGDEAEPADRRKFMYAPSVSQVNDEATESGKYELIVIVSGNRVNPQGETVMDRAYGIRDYLVDETIGASNFPACNPEDTGCSVNKQSPIQHPANAEDPETDLLDVTAQGDLVIRDDSGGSIVLRDENGTQLGSDDSTLLNLQQGYGWFFELEAGGEKGFSAVSVLDGTAFFTTYLPPDEASGNQNEQACSAPAALGTSRLYAVDALTGAPAFEYYNGDQHYQADDRYKGLGPGPSADVVPAHLAPGVTLVVPTGGAAVAEDPNLGTRAFKSFWFEEQ